MVQWKAGEEVLYSFKVPLVLISKQSARIEIEASFWDQLLYFSVLYYMRYQNPVSVSRNEHWPLIFFYQKVYSNKLIL